MKIIYPKTKVMTALAVLNTTVPITGNISNIANAVLECEYDAATSAGAVVLESAPRADYAGAWVNEGTMTWSAVSKSHKINAAGPFGALRARISVGVVGGFVDVWFRGAS